MRPASPPTPRHRTGVHAAVQLHSARRPPGPASGRPPPGRLGRPVRLRRLRHRRAARRRAGGERRDARTGARTGHRGAAAARRVHAADRGVRQSGGSADRPRPEERSRSRRPRAGGGCCSWTRWPTGGACSTVYPSARRSAPNWTCLHRGYEASRSCHAGPPPRPPGPEDRRRPARQGPGDLPDPQPAGGAEVPPQRPERGLLYGEVRAWPSAGVRPSSRSPRGRSGREPSASGCAW